MATADHDWVKEQLLIDGQRECNALGWIHTLFTNAAKNNNRPQPSVVELQQSTLNMIRELVSEDLVILGKPNPSKAEPRRFDAWNLPLDQAMAKIEHAYIDNFDEHYNWRKMFTEPDNWRNVVYIELTDKGRALADQLTEETLPPTEHDWVKEQILTDCLMDWDMLAAIHSLFMDAAETYGRPRPPVAEVQQSTLNMIHELVTDGLVILGIPNPTKTEPRRFDAWDLPLDQAMAKIEHAYIDNFDDWDWRTIVWLELTEKGRTLAHEIEDSW